MALVLMLFLKLDTLQERLEASPQSSKQLKSSEPLALLPAESAPAEQERGLDSRQLRRIIREELQVLNIGQESLARIPDSNEASPVFDEIEMEYQRELVLEKLDVLKEQDEVSSLALDELLSDIARLDPERRTAMMKLLNGAMNRGEIKGHL